MTENKEIEVLNIINDSPEKISQRDLAQEADLSLGLTNAILKKLVTKGLLVMKRLNSRNIRYALTPEGIAEIGRRSEALLRATFKNVVRYRFAIEQMIIGLKNKNFDGLYIEGGTELDFIFEWACMKHDMHYGLKDTHSRVFTINKDDLLVQIESLLKKEEA